MAEQAHTFVARNGQGSAVSSIKDGSNLPGGADAWEYRVTLDASEMDATSGVVGVGNAAEVLQAVRASGFFVSASHGA